MIFKTLVQLGIAACISTAALADPDDIRKVLRERYPSIKSIDEITPAKISGLFEVRINEVDIVYTDSNGNYMLQGALIDTAKKENLTEARILKLTALKFESLPFADAVVIKKGNGDRKLAVFADPNCGYCKKFEKVLQDLPNVTVYLFMYPVLGEESVEMSKNIWCAKDQAASWSNWMLNGVPLQKSSCNSSAVARNTELGRKHKITGTPTLIFESGERVPGAITAAQVESKLATRKPALN